MSKAPKTGVRRFHWPIVCSSRRKIAKDGQMRILIAEDERLTRRNLRRQLERMGHEVVDAEDGAQAWQLFQADSFPIVISDWEMPEVNGVELVRRIRESDCPSYVYIVLLTGKSDKEDVVAGMEAGADDFISKPFDRDELRARLSAGKRIVELEHHLAEANDRLRHELAVARELSDAEHRNHEDVLLGDSFAVRTLREKIGEHARSDQPLLLCGRSGAGQEAVARAIHRGSARCDRPFINVDCTHLAHANPTELGLSSESEAGNDSERLQVLGKAFLADGGTLYLEGVEALSSESQKELRRLFSPSHDSSSDGHAARPDVRVIASLLDHRDGEAGRHELDPEVARTLQQSRLHLPSLVERREDIPVIAQSVLERRARAAGKVLEGICDESQASLREYSWPGNVRELRGVIERAVLLASRGEVRIPPELLREGRRVGGYTLQRRLGQGGMGEVWLAQHSLLARPSAVKLIRQESLSGDAEARAMYHKRFQLEAKATAQLRSPNTVELYDFGITEEGDYYYVMEYLQGVDLHTLIERTGAISSARTVHLMTQACLSLEEAHRSGLVHRDIKPANLFLCALGPQYDFLKLLDFGIVRVTTGLDQSTTGKGLLRGTPECISPEAANGNTATPASDIYGLGCVAYWLLAGRPVFESPSVMTRLIQHMTKTPRPISDFQPNIEPEINQLVMRCLSKEPDDRPANAEELGELFESIRLNEPWDNAHAKAWWDSNRWVLNASGTGDETRDTATGPPTTAVPVPSHPTDAQLRQWMDGVLSIKLTASLEEHLEDCDECAERIGEIGETQVADDRFIHRVREVMDEDDDDSDRSAADSDG